MILGIHDGPTHELSLCKIRYVWNIKKAHKYTCREAMGGKVEALAPKIFKNFHYVYYNKYKIRLLCIK